MTVREYFDTIRPGTILVFQDNRHVLKLKEKDVVADLADGSQIHITELVLLYEEYTGQFFSRNKCHECEL